MASLASTLKTVKAIPSLPAHDFETLTQFLSASPSFQQQEEQRTTVLKILERMMKDHVTATMPGQEAALMVMVGDAMDDPALVIDCYRCLRDAQVPPSPMTLELTASACAATAEWETAMEVVQFMHSEVDNMHPCEEIYEDAITACQKAQQWIKAKQLLEEMQQYDLEPSSDLFLQCIVTCIECQELTAIKQLLPKFIQKYADEDLDAVWTTLVTTAIACQQMEHLRYLWAQRKPWGIELDQAITRRLMEFMASCREWTLVRDVLLVYLGPNTSIPQPSAHHMTPAIEMMVETMESQGLEVSRAFCNMVMREYGRHQEHRRAMRLLSKMHQNPMQSPDTTTYHAAMRSCGSNYETSEALYQEMQAKNLPITADVVHARLLALLRGRQYADVVQLFDELMESSDDAALTEAVAQDTRILSLVVMAHSHLEHPEDVLELFTQMKRNGLEPTLHVYAAAMTAYVHTSHWRRALLLFDHLGTRQSNAMDAIRNTPKLWEAAVLAATTGHQSDRLMHFYHQIMVHSIQITPTTAALFLEQLTDFSTTELWLSFRDMEHLHRTKAHGDTRTIATVMNAALLRAVEEQDVVLAETIVDEGLSELSIAPTAATFASMLRLYATKGDVVRFHAWCRRLRDANVKPSIGTYRAFFRYLKHVHNTSEEAIGSIGQALGLSSDAMGRCASVAAFGRLVLQSMDQQNVAIDDLCVDFYLQLDRGSEPTMEPEDLVYVKRILDQLDATAFCPPAFVSRVLSMVSPTDAMYHQAIRLMAKAAEDDTMDEILARCCASSTSEKAITLLQHLLQTNAALTDDHVVLVLTSCVANEDPMAVQNHQIDTVSRILRQHPSLLGHSTLAVLIQRLGEAYATETDHQLDQTKHLVRQKLQIAGFSRMQAHQLIQKLMETKDTMHQFEEVLSGLQ